MTDGATTQQFPSVGGILLGLGLGGFFDGIVFHQVLQWHHMLSSAGYPPTTVENLRMDVLADGLFHVSTFAFVVFGIYLLWNASRRQHKRWSGSLLFGSLLIGFGLFNVVEGLIDHFWLGIHHVNETAPRAQWIWWDLGFLAWGAAMLILGWIVCRSGQTQVAQSPAAPPRSWGKHSSE